MAASRYENMTPEELQNLSENEQLEYVLYLTEKEAADQLSDRNYMISRIDWALEESWILAQKEEEQRQKEEAILQETYQAAYETYIREQNRTADQAETDAELEKVLALSAKEAAQNTPSHSEPNEHVNPPVAVAPAEEATVNRQTPSPVLGDAAVAMVQEGRRLLKNISLFKFKPKAYDAQKRLNEIEVEKDSSAENGL